MSVLKELKLCVRFEDFFDGDFFGEGKTCEYSQTYLKLILEEKESAPLYKLCRRKSRFERVCWFLIPNRGTLRHSCQYFMLLKQMLLLLGGGEI